MSEQTRQYRDMAKTASWTLVSRVLGLVRDQAQKGKNPPVGLQNAKHPQKGDDESDPGRLPDSVTRHCPLNHRDREGTQAKEYEPVEQGVPLNVIIKTILRPQNEESAQEMEFGIGEGEYRVQFSERP